MVCKGCGSNSVAIDESAGNTVCTNCGVVCEENNIVSDITFGENSAGGAMVHGQLVAHNRTGVGFATVHGNRYSSDSRVTTLDNAQRVAQGIANQLHVTSYVERAMRFFKLALQDTFTRGRRIEVTMATCLYIACRYDKVGLMLINFSEAIGVNVFQLGSTYLAICKRLLLNDLPPIDPSLYVSRFCSLLNFGEKTKDVIQSACGYLKRMEKDWILDGRRPAGVCGACVLLAARTLGFKCTTRDFIGVVKMTEDTILKRLLEFSETPSGNLTVHQFNNIFLEESELPPSFKKAKQSNVDIFPALLRDENKNEQDKEADEYERVRNFSQDMIKYLSACKDSAANQAIQMSDENELADLEALDDDPEVKNCILSEKEFKDKEEWWLEENADYLEKEQAKQERIKAGILKAPSKRKSKKVKIERDFAGNTAMDSFTNMVYSDSMSHLKRLSKKINYDAIKDALSEATVSQAGVESVVDAITLL